jgi:hypothetical protein
MFDYKAEVPAVDGTGTEMVTLEFRPVEQLPIGILRRNRYDQESQMWAMFEWGLSADQLAVFDRLPAVQLQKILADWQASEKDPDTETPDTTDAPDATDEDADTESGE